MDFSSNKGVTLVALVITIVVMIMVSAITIPVGIDHVNRSKDQKLLSEIEMVNNAIGQRYILYNKTKNVDLLIGTPLELGEVETLASNRGIELVNIPVGFSEEEKAYYEIIPEDLIELGFENAEHIYIVNYLTGEVINKTVAITGGGEILYTYSRSIFNNE